MQKLILITLAAAIIVSASLPAQANPSNGVKVNPYGVDFPLIAPSGYRSTSGDPFERSFGIRRWLRPISSEERDHQKSLDESYKWNQIYGGYGVLGHGEEVFSNAAERWRLNHRGH